MCILATCNGCAWWHERGLPLALTTSLALIKQLPSSWAPGGPFLAGTLCKWVLPVGVSNPRLASTCQRGLATYDHVPDSRACGSAVPSLRGAMGVQHHITCPSDAGGGVEHRGGAARCQPALQPVHGHPWHPWLPRHVWNLCRYL
jgi:hypothetical protein